MPDKYRIETRGDDERVEFVDSWDEVVARVAFIMYRAPTKVETQDVREMLEHGTDDCRGWNGEVVVITFEDGTLEVLLVRDEKS